MSTPHAEETAELAVTATTDAGDMDAVMTEIAEVWGGAMVKTVSVPSEEVAEAERAKETVGRAAAERIAPPAISVSVTAEDVMCAGTAAP